MSYVQPRSDECDRPALAARVKDACAADVSPLESLRRVLALTGGELHFSVCSYWHLTPDGSALVCHAAWADKERIGDGDEFVVFTRNLAFSRGFGLPGMAWEKAGIVIVDSINDERKFVRTAHAQSARLRNGIAVPVISGGEVAGVLECIGHEAGRPGPHTIGCLQDIAQELGALAP